MAQNSAAPMTREDVTALMGRLLEGVPPASLPLVAAQAVWGMGPWSSRTPYVRAMAAWVAERFGDDLPAVPRALTLAACGRATLADRRFFDAIEECEAAVDEAGRGGDERVVRTCRALLARALLHNGQVGRGFEALEGVTDDDLPLALRPEVLLALGLADILLGEPDRAAERFSGAARVAEGLGTEPGSTAQWHRAMARAGQAHALIRSFRFADAIPPLDASSSVARENDAEREAADLEVLRAACSLATGEKPPRPLSNVLDRASRLVGATPGIDFLFGLPADLAGCGSANEAATRLEEGAVERLRMRDEAGVLLAVLATAAFRVEVPDRAAANRILQAALEAATNLGWDGAVDTVARCRDALELV